MSGQSTDRAEHITFGDPDAGLRVSTRQAPARVTTRLADRVAGDPRSERFGPRRTTRTVGVVAALDFAAVVVAALAAGGMTRHAVAPTSTAHWLSVLLLPGAWLTVLTLNGGLRERDIGLTRVEVNRILRTALHLAVLAATASYVIGVHLPRGPLLTALALAVICDVGARVAGTAWERRRGHPDLRARAVLAVGDTRSVAAFSDAVARDTSTRLAVRDTYVLDAEAEDPGSREFDASDIDAVFAAARDVNAAAVAVMSASQFGSERLRALAWQLEGSGIELLVSSGIAEVAHRRLRVHAGGWTPLLCVREPEFSGLRRVAKSAIDRLVAGVVLILLSPLFATLVLVVRLSTPGPAFFRQTRVGRDGTSFRMLKFRSMYRDADSRLAGLRSENVYRAGPLFKLHDDPRVTPVGRVLRRYSLDELPQLVNVLLGHMSLVGPRPPLPGEVAQYAADVRRRLLVKPGITGLWQVSGRNDLSWRDSVRLDLRYVENWSPALDLLILWKTVAAVVRGTGAY